ncbi:MAG: S-layer homology domain-containing protein, partial [Firmicutes bacterium]|nr:S-layer homology domain-containing protein [Bacillota bacterium]
NITPPGYGDGIIFAAQNNGRLEAVDYDTLQIKWTQKPASGQSNCPVMYRDGYAYTGYWNGPSQIASYVCVDAETGDTVWTLDHPGGFYWAGSYVGSDFLLIGADDGQGTSDIDDTSTGADGTFYSVKPGNQANNGKAVVIDQIDDIYGDIRCTVCFVPDEDGLGGGWAYFTTCGGRFYGVHVKADGAFYRNEDQSLDEDHFFNIDLTTVEGTKKSTSTPVIHNGRAYIGLVGKDQFTADGDGHGIGVIDLESRTLAYSIRSMGCVQTSGLLTTAYEEEDGYSYIYFVENYQPGKIRVIKDQPGQTKPIRVDGAENEYADILFTPFDKQREYAIASLVCDAYGVMYYKNDSCYIMAVGPSIEKIEVTKQPTKTKYYVGETFDPSGMQVIATYANGLTRDVTKYVTYNTAPLTTKDLSIRISFTHQMYKDADDGKNNDANKEGQSVPVLYAATPVSITVEDNPAADVIEMIDDLKGCITEETVVSATAAYDKLTAEQKKQVTNYSELQKAQETVKAGTPFTDVAPDSWYKEAVDFAYYNGLMNGVSDTTFGPDGVTTRAQLVTILYRYAGSPQVSGEVPFTDLDAKGGSWYMDGVKWAYQNKIVNGTGATTFSPNNQLTREQLVTILYRYCNEYLHMNTSEREGLSKYSDVKLVDNYAMGPFQWAVAKGYVSGTSATKLSPDDSATRAQISTIMMRFAKSL